MASALRTHESLKVAELRARAAAQPLECLEGPAAQAMVEGDGVDAGGDGLMGLLVLAASQRPVADKVSFEPVTTEPQVVAPSWDEPRPATASLARVVSDPPFPPASVSRPGLTLGVASIAAIAAIAGAAVALTALSARDAISPTVRHAAIRPLAKAPRGLGKLAVQSEPAGALVFLNGEPTGLRTPTELKAIPVGEQLEVRVEMTGFQSQQRRLSLEAAQPGTLSFLLPPSTGRVRLVGAPPGADLYVDGAIVHGALGEPTQLRVGHHSIRVELDGALLFAADVPVVAGEQTLHVDLPPKGP